MINHIKPTQWSKFRKRDNGANLEKQKQSILQHQNKIIENQSESISFLCGKLDELMNVMKSNQNPSTNTKKNNIKQFRDLSIDIDVPVLPKDEPERQNELKKWLTLLCQQTISASFSLFQTKKLDDPKTKVYCSENILKNILLLTKKNKLSKNDFTIANDSIKKTISYYLKKYPQSQGTQINKKLLKQILKTNSLDSNKNNILAESGITFTLRQNGNYHDYIMMFINYLLEIMNLKDDKGKSRFNRFQQMFEDIFTSASEKQWVEGFNPEKYDKQYLLSSRKEFFTSLEQKRKGQKQNEKLKKQAQAYEKSFNQYSSYRIGQKISQNTPQYSEQQIQSGHIVIKSTSILRILAKWCEQLQKKYFDATYFLQKDEDMIQQKGGLSTFSSKNKQRITGMIQQEKQKIKQYLKYIQQNNYQNQSKYNYDKLSKDEFYHIDQGEKVFGKFVTKNMKCLSAYIISYLNRLIHGILKVSKEFYDKDVKNFSNWPNPPELLTFFIGDLIRCKFSSHEKQVIRVYKELQTLSHLYPENFKIIRIKNRLNLGTRDILINAKFQDKILCEIQLGINAEKNEFLYCSDKFNHYLYELKRSPFGPISEMCNIWGGNDIREKEFKTLLEEEKHQTKKQHDCDGKSLVLDDLPFDCSVCGITRYRNKYIFNNLKCDECDEYWICGSCQINKTNDQTLLERISASSHQALPKIKQKIMKGHPPEYGIFINIQSRFINFKEFKCIKIQNTYYIFNKNNNTNYKLFFEFKNHSPEMKDFYEKNIVFEIGKIPQLKDVQKKDIIKELKTARYLKDIFKKKKQAINIEKQGISQEDILKIDGGEGNDRIFSLSVSANEIKSIQGLTQRFKNLSYLTLSHNKINSLVGIGNVPQLKRLRVISNDISQIPSGIGKCTKIEKISFQNNSLQRIPSQIGYIENLRQLWLDNNNIEEIPAQIGKLKSLQNLMAPNNPIKQISQEIGKLQKLQKMRFSTNKLTKIPKSIVNLTNLFFLNLSSNKIEEFPIGINKMEGLKRIYLGNNNLTSFPQGICELSKLQTINLMTNKITEIPSAIADIEKLTYLYLSWNKIEQIPNNMNKLKKLKEFGVAFNNLRQLPSDLIPPSLLQLSLKVNQLTSIPEEFQNLSQLKILNVEKNSIKKLPTNLCSLTNLEELMIMENQIQEFPKNIHNLTKLKKFHFEGNKIKQIPQEFRQLQNLSQIGLGSKELVEIPKVIFQMTDVKELQIDGYGLTQIPQQLFNLTNLKELNLHNNKISSIPDSISKLTKLNNLRINGNKLKSLNKNIKHLKNLNQLYLQDNQLSELPDQIYSLPLTILSISKNKFKHFPKDFEKLTKIRTKFFKFLKNPLETVDCREFLLKKGSRKSQKFFKNWEEKNLQEQDDDDDNQSVQQN